jgi:hypothetical protein
LRDGNVCNAARASEFEDPNEPIAPFVYFLPAKQAH